MRSSPLAWAWAGVKPSAGAWGRRKSPTNSKSAEPLPVQPGVSFLGGNSRPASLACLLPGLIPFKGATNNVGVETRIGLPKLFHDLRQIQQPSR